MRVFKGLGFLQGSIRARYGIYRPLHVVVYVGLWGSMIVQALGFRG